MGDPCSASVWSEWERACDGVRGREGLARSASEGRGSEQEELRARVRGAGADAARDVPEVPSGARRPVGVQPAVPAARGVDDRRLAVGGDRSPERAALPPQRLQERDGLLLEVGSRVAVKCRKGVEVMTTRELFDFVTRYGLRESEYEEYVERVGDAVCVTSRRSLALAR